MNTSVKNTAVLVFVRTVSEEAGFKKLGPANSVRQNYNILSVLNRRIKRVCMASGLPTLVISGTQQHGSSFGERLANAIEAAFDKGFDKVIAVGNDCLQVSETLLNLAASQLETCPVVLGPDTNGGHYLIGLSKAAFHRKSFIELPWQSKHLQRDFERYLSENDLHFQYLVEASDINHAIDLLKALRHLSAYSRLYKVLKYLLFKYSPADQMQTVPVNHAGAIIHPSLRGPPFLTLDR